MQDDKENYYLFTLEVVIADDPPLELLEEHLQYYEEQEEYLACAGIKLGIEFARFNRLLNLYKQQNDKRNN